MYCSFPSLPPSSSLPHPLSYYCNSSFSSSSRLTLNSPYLCPVVPFLSPFPFLSFLSIYNFASVELIAFFFFFFFLNNNKENVLPVVLHALYALSFIHPFICSLSLQIVIFLLRAGEHALCSTPKVCLPLEIMHIYMSIAPLVWFTVTVHLSL